MSDFSKSLASLSGFREAPASSTYVALPKPKRLQDLAPPETAREKTTADNNYFKRAAEPAAKGLLLEHFFKDRSLGPSVFDRIINVLPQKLPFMFMPPTGEFIEKQMQNTPEHKKLFPKEAPTA